jgi:serine-type D-Ala-D-Ala carboxypeptidase (penicillin-binding protein 5/6)
MMRTKTRLGWAPALVVLAAVALVIALTGTVSGTSTTLSVTSTSLPSVGETSAPTGDGVSATAFTVEAADLGYFDVSAPKISSPSAIVINLSTGKVLYEKKADTQRPMASTTKIMTAVLALESLSLDKQITISQKAAQTTEVKSFLREGDVLTVEQLLYCLLVHSSNASAVALAEAVAGDVDAFAEKMNAKAADLGMEDTHFVNPNGLDATGHYSTAADMAKVGQYAMKNTEFRKFVSTKSYTLELPGRDEPLAFDNTNKLMLSTSWVVGVKTGLTPRAEQCLVAAGTKDGVSILSVVLGQPSTDVCWTESRALLEYGLAQYKHVKFVGANVAVAEAAIPYHNGEVLQLVTKTSLEMDLFKDDDVTASVKIDRQLTLPVQAGESYGEIELSMNGDKVGSVELVADKSIGEPTLGTKLSDLWHRLVN